MAGYSSNSDQPDHRDDSDRVVVVTGAGKGLGEAFAKAWASRGARVVVSNRRRAGAADDAGRVVDEIRSAGGQAIAEYSDMADPGAGEAVVGAALKAFGRLDAVIANAGTSGPARKLTQGSLADFRDVMETNFFSNIALAEAAQAPLQASPSGRFLLISSSAGLYGVRGRAPYAASKGALNAFAMSLASEWRRDGVGVNILAPYAATRMTDAPDLDPALAAAIAPANVGAVAVWLSSAACRQSGEIWVSGAGWLRRAQMVEGRGATAAADMSAEDVEALAGTLRGLEELRGFAGAEAAFADLIRECQAAHAAPAQSAAKGSEPA
ncbi:SDR family NAD(P)-dependent oxidoreductase [Maricaulis sp.]|uniref:SDR family NAD(P)-dependent oxidoreductase n=1 Tax=Maricaulis sp. TaxID=1486257 RepID=UPI003A8E0D03